MFAYRRKGSRLPVLAAASLLAFVALPSGIAHADEKQFDMSSSSGRPGDTIDINQDDACPSIPSGFDYQYVEFTFIDADEVQQVSTYTASTNSSGDWTSNGLIVIPRQEITQYDPPVFSDEAAFGYAEVKARCVRVDEGVQEETSQEYATQEFNVTGSSRQLQSPTSVEGGEMVDVSSSSPCYGDIVVTVLSNEGYSGFTKESNGNWQADVLAASYLEEENKYVDFTPGSYAVRANCLPTNQTYGFSYGDKAITVTDDAIDVIAMGDSYTSGEGVEPFEEGTEGAGECHRSVWAYPRLLADDPALDLSFGADGFVACSGATTAAITLGYNDEGAQMDKITADTDLMVMTIGGNNMPFGEFAEACVVPLETCDGTPKTEAFAGIVNDVIPDMEYMLGTVEDRLTTLDNSDAELLVVGYPQVVTDNPWITPNSDCWWLNDEDEADAIRTVTQSLNTAIKNEVEAVGGNFHFVSATSSGSPFIGHELCRDSLSPEAPFFRNYNPVAPEVYTFHPNEEGQQAYAELVTDYLVQNSLI